jgi:Zn-dependent peptidase ImmA (M78 family)
MLSDLASGSEIAELTDRILREARAYDCFPTPVEDIIAAAKLNEPKHSLLSNFILEQAPRHLREAVAPLRRKISALLDREEREIHLDPTIENEGQRRFKRCHEISHDIYPWQEALGFADDEITLSPRTRVLFEQEANQGAAELLFQRDRFRTIAADYALGFGSVVELSQTFGTSIHASFRRYVETHRSTVAGLVLEASPRSRSPLTYHRHEAIHSASWTAQFGSPNSWLLRLQVAPFSFVQEVSRARGALTPPRTTFTFPDLANEQQLINVETFSNHYRGFVLLWLPHRERIKRRPILLPSTAGAV